MQCTNCGAALNPNARFCPNCAAPVSGGPSNRPPFPGGQSYPGGPNYPAGAGYPGPGYAPPYAPRPKSKLPLIIGAIALILLIGGGVAAYFLFFKSSDSPSAVAQNYLRAFERGNTTEMLGYLSKAQLNKAGINLNNKEQMKEIDSQLAKALEAIKQQGGITQIETANEKIQGETATVDATLRIGKSEPQTKPMRLVKEDGKWKVDETPEMASEAPATPGDADPGKPDATIGPGATPREVAREFFSAAEAGDASRLKKVVASSVQDEIDDIVEDGTAEIKNHGGVASFYVLNEKNDGGSVILEFNLKFGDGTSRPGEMVMVKEDGEWKMEQIRDKQISSTEPPPPPPPPVSAPPVSPPPYTQTNTTASEQPAARSGGSIQASAIKRVEPVYPPLAKAAKVSGSVVIEVTVDGQGNVTQARTVSGHPLLKSAAETAARQWKFRPTGTPVIGNITFNFSS